MTASDLVGRLPVVFDPRIYRELHDDLRSFADSELEQHYVRHGIREGRRAHSLEDRTAFANLARDVDVLEIGPFDAPLLHGPRVYYFDILDRAGLVERAERIGRNPERVPERVHFTSATGDLGVVDRKFNAVLSSHVVEHQPDLVRHFQAIQRLLSAGGVYLMLVPDHRYCFDHFMAPSTIADVLDAHYSHRLIHTLKSQIEHVALTTHNRAALHWAGDHAEPPQVVENTRQALKRFRAEPDAYVDVHAWYFTPNTFEAILGLLNELGLTTLRPARIYPTLERNNEFWVVLEAAPSKG